MRVETVSFVTAIRLPNGKVESSISLQNRHHKLNYELTCDPKSGILTIKAVAGASWVVIVPLTNCSFIVLANANTGARKGKPRTPASPAKTPPMTPVVRKRSKPRAQKG